MNKALFEKLEQRTTKQPNGCWIWTGAKNRGGYGNTYVDGKYLNAHRAMWSSIHGLPPRGVSICHRCDNPACINPKHLFAGSQHENMLDKAAKGRALAGPCASESWWTPERRAKRSSDQRRRAEIDRMAAANAAGVPDNWKYCPSCLSWKSRQEFHLNKSRHDGLKPHCKPCSIAKDVERQRRKN